MIIPVLLEQEAVLDTHPVPVVRQPVKRASKSSLVVVVAGAYPQLFTVHYPELGVLLQH